MFSLNGQFSEYLQFGRKVSRRQTSRELLSILRSMLIRLGCMIATYLRDEKHLSISDALLCQVLTMRLVETASV